MTAVYFFLTRPLCDGRLWRRLDLYGPAGRLGNAGLAHPHYRFNMQYRRRVAGQLSGRTRRAFDWRMALLL